MLCTNQDSFYTQCFSYHGKQTVEENNNVTVKNNLRVTKNFYKKQCCSQKLLSKTMPSIYHKE